MSKVRREVIADGDFHEVSVAVLSDGSSPFLGLLSELEQGLWPDPAQDEFPDSWQPKMRARLLAEFEELADVGEPARDYDYLTDGIWELKIGNLRVTFYDTRGDGTWNKHEGRVIDSHWAARRREFPDDFDEFVRVGHYFAKTSQKTLARDLEEAKRVREEDLSHDRN